MKYKGYLIHLVCANVKNNMYEDVYNSFDDCRKEHPNDGFKFGYYVESLDDYEDVPDWFDSIEEAIHWIETK